MTFGHIQIYFDAPNSQYWYLFCASFVREREKARDERERERDSRGLDSRDVCRRIGTH